VRDKNTQWLDIQVHSTQQQNVTTAGMYVGSPDKHISSTERRYNYILRVINIQ